LLVAEVKKSKFLSVDEWQGHLDKMPLPSLDLDSPGEQYAVFFDALYLASPDALDRESRIAILSPLGIHLLMQRWVVHTSRAVVPTQNFHAVIRGQYEEADLTEEWCADRVGSGVDVAAATKEAVDWLRESSADGMSRQDLLTDQQKVSVVRREMRQKLRELNQPSQSK
jgi:hypothetical protein